MVGGLLSMKSLRDTERGIEKVLDQIERRGQKDALMKAATPMVRATKGAAKRHKRSGALWKSIGKKGKTFKNTRSAWVGIGPRSGYRGPNGERPSRYAHLLEYGTRKMKARAFMRPGYASSHGESRRVYEREIRTQIEKHARRFRSRGKI